MKFNGKTLSVAADFTGGGADPYYHEFWDEVQDNGTRTDYTYGFCHTSWTDAIFKPKYDIVPSRASYMFTQTGITDLQAALDRAGVRLDFSEVQGNYITRPFDGSKITRVGVVDIAHVTATINTFFANAAELITIELLRVDADGATKFGANMFQGCAKLQDITIDGMLDTDIDLSMCPLLTVESLKSIILHLKSIGDYSRTIKLAQDCWQRLDAAGGQPDGDNWLEYVENYLCWNGEYVA